jgi:type II secretion system protein G
MKKRGFTLIEMLIVVAIIGILAALLIPNALSAIQKAKQKGTMKDINSIAIALTDYVTDKGETPTQSGALQAGSTFYTALSGFYVRIIPQNDQWGTPFQIFDGSAGNSSGYSGVTGCGSDDFVVASQGRDKILTTITFNPLTPSTAYFDITGMTSFNEDLVIWNGSWIHVPKVAPAGT